jgi:hypothetical protein
LVRRHRIVNRRLSIYSNRHRTDVQNRIQFWLSEVGFWQANPIAPNIPTNTVHQTVPPWDAACPDVNYPPAIWARDVPKNEQ